MRYLLILLSVLFGYIATYGLTYLYVKYNSDKLKEEFSWFGSKEYRKMMYKAEGAESR